jgi:uncharacterized membrane protein
MSDPLGILDGFHVREGRVATEPPTRPRASHPLRCGRNAKRLTFLQRDRLCHCDADRPRTLPLTMSPLTRRVLQAILYEVIAIAVVGPALAFAFKEPQTSTFGLAVVLSTIALAWNYTFNWMFERWESRRAVRGRSFARRLAHGAGFEGGLAVILVPVMSLWLDISPITAFVANLALLAFFFVYAIAFTWAFDRVFGLPASARSQSG